MASYEANATQRKQILQGLVEGKPLEQVVEEVTPWLKGCEYWIDIVSFSTSDRILIVYEPSAALIAKRDSIDTLCYDLAYNIAREDDVTVELPWDMVYIGKIRDAVVEYLSDHLGDTPEHWY